GLPSVSLSANAPNTATAIVIAVVIPASARLWRSSWSTAGQRRLLRPSGVFLLGALAGIAVALSVLVAVAQDLIRRGAVGFPASSPPRAAVTGGPPMGPRERAGRRLRDPSPKGKKGGKGVAVKEPLLPPRWTVTVALRPWSITAPPSITRGSWAHMWRKMSMRSCPPITTVPWNSLNNADLERIHFSVTIDVRPRGVPSLGSVLYTSAPLTAAEISELLAEAGQACNLERARRRLPRLGDAVRAIGGAATAATPVHAVVPAPGGARFAPAGGAWVLAEPLIGHDVGAEFAMPVGAAALGSMALVVIDGVVASLEMLAEGAGIARWALARGNLLCDDPRAQTERALVEAVGLITACTRQAEGLPPPPLLG
ncbi:unnamed protein product, partial [Prorocentrum cordatum]